MQLLLMEQDTAVRELLHYALRLEGHAVDAVSRWAEMLEALASNRNFDAVLTEIVLPQDRDHADAVATAEHRGIPVVLMTGDTGTMLELDRGKIPYLEKPFQIERLLERINTIGVRCAAPNPGGSGS